MNLKEFLKTHQNVTEVWTSGENWYTTKRDGCVLVSVKDFLKTEVVQEVEQVTTEAIEPEKILKIKSKSKK